MITLIFALAATAFVVAPASADIKFTSKGYMQIQSLYLSAYPIKVDGNEGSNNWYNMEMVITPTLHINDKVRIHAQIRMMERNYSGTAAGDLYLTNAAESKYNVFGDSQNNFWLERLYISFPAFGGNFQIGRRSGGNWANAFADSDQNRDRILYIRRFGPFTVLGLVEKRDERDGGLAAPRFSTVAVPAGYQEVDGDQDAYALGAVMPFSKNIVIRPLWYGIRDGRSNLLGAGDEPSWFHIFMLGGVYKFGPVKFEHEIHYLTSDAKGSQASGGDLKFRGWDVYASLGMNFGPVDVGLHGFWIEGGDHDATSNERTFGLPTGERFQPLLLLFSEDMGFLFNTRGVPNGSVDTNGSGYVCLYAPVGFKISDDMKVGAVIGYLRADTMQNGSRWDGKKADKELGWEVDASFEWRFLDNIKFISTGGFFTPGDYFKDATNLGDTTVWGWRNTIRVEW
jgi:hypothetical protein